jgi:hypothetical protein
MEYLSQITEISCFYIHRDWKSISILRNQYFYSTAPSCQIHFIVLLPNYMCFCRYERSDMLKRQTIVHVFGKLEHFTDRKSYSITIRGWDMMRTATTCCGQMIQYPIVAPPLTCYLTLWFPCWRTLNIYSGPPL